MEILEQNDEFEKGLYGGLQAGLAMLLFVEAFRIAGLTKYDIFYIASETVFSHAETWYSYLLGLVVHAGISVMWGIVFCLLLYRVFNRKRRFTKVIFCSFAVFMFHFGIMDEPFHYDRAMHKATLDMVVYLAGYVIYGLVLGHYLFNNGRKHGKTPKKARP